VKTQSETDGNDPIFTAAPLGRWPILRVGLIPFPKPEFRIPRPFNYARGRLLAFFAKGGNHAVGDNDVQAARSRNEMSPNPCVERDWAPEIPFVESKIKPIKGLPPA